MPQVQFFAWRIDVQVWARVLPFALYMVFLALEKTAADLTAIDVRWLYPVKIVAVIAALWRYRAVYTELLAPPNWLWTGLVAPLLGLLVFALWINLDAGWMNLGGGAGFDPRDVAAGDIEWMLVIPRLVGAALVVPLMEELFWRSFLLRWVQQQDFLALEPARIGLRAILICSVLFGVEHSLWLAGIVAGLAYVWIYRASGNLWPPIVAHATTNLVLGLWVLQTGAWQFW